MVGLEGEFGTIASHGEAQSDKLHTALPQTSGSSLRSIEEKNSSPIKLFFKDYNVPQVCQENVHLTRFDEEDEYNVILSPGNAAAALATGENDQEKAAAAPRGDKSATIALADCVALNEDRISNEEKKLIAPDATQEAVKEKADHMTKPPTLYISCKERKTSETESATAHHPQARRCGSARRRSSKSQTDVLATEHCTQPFGKDDNAGDYFPQKDATVEISVAGPQHWDNEDKLCGNNPALVCSIIRLKVASPEGDATRRGNKKQGVRQEGSAKEALSDGDVSSRDFRGRSNSTCKDISDKHKECPFFQEVLMQKKAPGSLLHLTIKANLLFSDEVEDKQPDSVAAGAAGLMVLHMCFYRNLNDISLVNASNVMPPSRTSSAVTSLVDNKDLPSHETLPLAVACMPLWMAAAQLSSGSKSSAVFRISLLSSSSSFGPSFSSAFPVNRFLTAAPLLPKADDLISLRTALEDVVYLSPDNSNNSCSVKFLLKAGAFPHAPVSSLSFLKERSSFLQSQDPKAQHHEEPPADTAERQRETWQNDLTEQPRYCIPSSDRKGDQGIYNNTPAPNNQPANQQVPAGQTSPCLPPSVVLRNEQQVIHESTRDPVGTSSVEMKGQGGNCAKPAKSALSSLPVELCNPCRPAAKAAHYSTKSEPEREEKMTTGTNSEGPVPLAANKPAVALASQHQAKQQAAATASIPAAISSAEVATVLSAASSFFKGTHDNSPVLSYPLMHPEMTAASSVFPACQDTTNSSFHSRTSQIQLPQAASALPAELRVTSSCAAQNNKRTEFLTSSFFPYKAAGLCSATGRTYSQLQQQPRQQTLSQCTQKTLSAAAGCEGSNINPTAHGMSANSERREAAVEEARYAASSASACAAETDVMSSVATGSCCTHGNIEAEDIYPDDSVSVKGSSNSHSCCKMGPVAMKQNSALTDLASQTASGQPLLQGTTAQVVATATTAAGGKRNITAAEGKGYASSSVSSQFLHSQLLMTQQQASCCNSSSHIHSAGYQLGNKQQQHLQQHKGSNSWCSSSGGLPSESEVDVSSKTAAGNRSTLTSNIRRMDVLMMQAQLILQRRKQKQLLQQQQQTFQLQQQRVVLLQQQQQHVSTGLTPNLQHSESLHIEQHSSSPQLEKTGLRRPTATAEVGHNFLAKNITLSKSLHPQHNNTHRSNHNSCIDATAEREFDMTLPSASSSAAGDATFLSTTKRSEAGNVLRSAVLHSPRVSADGTAPLHIADSGGNAGAESSYSQDMYQPKRDVDIQNSNVQRLQCVTPCKEGKTRDSLQQHQEQHLMTTTASSTLTGEEATILHGHVLAPLSGTQRRCSPSGAFTFSQATEPQQRHSSQFPYELERKKVKEIYDNSSNLLMHSSDLMQHDIAVTTTRTATTGDNTGMNQRSTSYTNDSAVASLSKDERQCTEAGGADKEKGETAKEKATGGNCEQELRLLLQQLGRHMKHIEEKLSPSQPQQQQKEKKYRGTAVSKRRLRITGQPPAVQAKNRRSRNSSTTSCHSAWEGHDGYDNDRSSAGRSHEAFHSSETIVQEEERKRRRELQREFLTPAIGHFLKLLRKKQQQQRTQMTHGCRKRLLPVGLLLLLKLKVKRRSYLQQKQGIHGAGGVALTPITAARLKALSKEKEQMKMEKTALEQQVVTMTREQQELKKVYEKQVSLLQSDLETERKKVHQQQEMLIEQTRQVKIDKQQTLKEQETHLKDIFQEEKNRLQQQHQEELQQQVEKELCSVRQQAQKLASAYEALSKKKEVEEELHRRLLEAKEHELRDMQQQMEKEVHQLRRQVEQQEQQLHQQEKQIGQHQAKMQQAERQQKQETERVQDQEKQIAALREQLQHQKQIEQEKSDTQDLLEQLQNAKGEITRLQQMVEVLRKEQRSQEKQAETGPGHNNIIASWDQVARLRQQLHAAAEERTRFSLQQQQQEKEKTQLIDLFAAQGRRVKVLEQQLQQVDEQLGGVLLHASSSSVPAKCIGVTRSPAAQQQQQQQQQIPKQEEQSDSASSAGDCYLPQTEDSQQRQTQHRKEEALLQRNVFQSLQSMRTTLRQLQQQLPLAVGSPQQSPNLVREDKQDNRNSDQQEMSLQQSEQRTQQRQQQEWALRRGRSAERFVPYLLSQSSISAGTLRNPTPPRCDGNTRFPPYLLQQNQEHASLQSSVMLSRMHLRTCSPAAPGTARAAARPSSTGTRTPSLTPSLPGRFKMSADGCAAAAGKLARNAPPPASAAVIAAAAAAADTSVKAPVATVVAPTVLPTNAARPAVGTSTSAAAGASATMFSPAHVDSPARCISGNLRSPRQMHQLHQQKHAPVLITRVMPATATYPHIDCNTAKDSNNDANGQVTQRTFIAPRAFDEGGAAAALTATTVYPARYRYCTPTRLPTQRPALSRTGLAQPHMTLYTAGMLAQK